MTLSSRPVTRKPTRWRFHWLKRARKIIAPLGAYLRNPAPPYLRMGLAVIMVAALLGLLVVALATLGAGVNLRALEQHRSDNDTAQLSASSIAQSFRSPRSGLSEIDVKLATIVGSPVDFPGDGKVRLLSGDGLDGPVLYQAPLNTTGWEKNPFLTVNFPPIAASEGATYTLVFETPGRPLNTSLGVEYNTFDTLSSGSMYIGGESAPGDISLQVWYHYDIASLLSDIGKALTSQGVLIISWLAFLMLPGMALLLWLPNNLSAGQRMIAAPALSE